jgi:hypothetical protein
MQIIDVNDMSREVKSVAPDPTYPGYVRVEFRRHHEWYTIQEFISKNPSLAHLAQNAPSIPQDFVGIITRATPTTLKDAIANWKENAYLGFYVWISRGKGEGQKRTVVSNTHNTLTIDQPWDTKPDKSSQYVLSFNVKEVHAQGNTLPQEDFKALEKRAIEMDKLHGRLTSEMLKKNIKHLTIDEI